MSGHSSTVLIPLPTLVKYRPLVLITGFLGAGKTTFLRRQLVQVKSQDLTADVILNDYENAALDAETLHDKAEIIAALAASHFVISHTDRADSAAVIEQVRSINPHATEITAARLASHLVTNIAEMQPTVSFSKSAAIRLPHRHGHHLAHAFNGCQILLPPRVWKKTILGWLAALPDSVYRAKALVSLVDSPEVRHLFERVAGDIMPNPLEASISQRVQPAAILIGPKLLPDSLLELARQHFGPLAKFPEVPSLQASHPMI